MIKIDRLTRAMSERNVSQGALAREIGVTPAAIQQLVNGKTKRTRHSRDIAHALNVSEDWLLGTSDEMWDASRDLLTNVAPIMFFKLQDMMRTRDTSLDRPAFVDKRFLPESVIGRENSHCFITDVGNGMLPTISNSDVLLVEYATDNKIDEQDRLWVIGDLLKNLVVRRLRIVKEGIYAVQADNPLRPTVEVPADQLVIVAKVVWQTRALTG